MSCTLGSPCGSGLLKLPSCGPAGGTACSHLPAGHSLAREICKAQTSQRPSAYSSHLDSRGHCCGHLTSSSKPVSKLAPLHSGCSALPHLLKREQSNSTW